MRLAVLIVTQYACILFCASNRNRKLKYFDTHVQSYSRTVKSKQNGCVLLLYQEQRLANAMLLGRTLRIASYRPQSYLIVMVVRKCKQCRRRPQLSSFDANHHVCLFIVMAVGTCSTACVQNWQINGSVLQLANRSVLSYSIVFAKP